MVDDAPVAALKTRIMTKQSITIELDNETIRCLATVGRPIDVLARLADSAADSMRGRRRRLMHPSIYSPTHPPTTDDPHMNTPFTAAGAQANLELIDAGVKLVSLTFGINLYTNQSFYAQPQQVSRPWTCSFDIAPPGNSRSMRRRR